MAILALDSLPVGYRFRPTDEELVNHFLRLKNNGDEDEVSDILVVDLCKQEPWDLPGNHFNISDFYIDMHVCRSTQMNLYKPSR